MHPIEGACMSSSVESLYELWTTVRIDGVIATVIGHHHVLKVVALCHPCSDGEHDTIAERHYRRLHILISIMAFRNGLVA